jgi:hypothetical protein
MPRNPSFRVSSTLLCAFSSFAFAGEYALTRTLPIGQRVTATFADYNADGFDDLLGPGPLGQLHLIDGRTGALLRTWTEEHGAAGRFADAVSAIPDLTGDGLPEILASAPAWPAPLGQGAFVAIPSSSPGGSVNSQPLVYRTDHPGGFPQSLAFASLSTDSRRTVVGLGDPGRALLTDTATGSVVASLARSTVAYQGGFGHSAGAIGDIDGDGTADFAIGDPNVLYVPNSSKRGEVYLVSGATSTPGDAYVPVDQLPGRLLTLHAASDLVLGAGLGVTFANLGDPNPADALHQRLLVAGTPFANNSSGGFAAFLVTRSAGGALSYAPVAEYAATDQNLRLGGDTVACGDVDFDGVTDVALLGRAFNDAQRGRVLILNGAGLLDGFDPAADVLQRISDPGFSLGDNLRSLGDYDHNGSLDLVLHFSGPEFQTRIYSLTPEPSMVAPALLALGTCKRRPARPAPRG